MIARSVEQQPEVTPMLAMIPGSHVPRRTTRPTAPGRGRAVGSPARSLHV